MAAAADKEWASRVPHWPNLGYGTALTGFLVLWGIYVALRIQPAIGQFHSGAILEGPWLSNAARVPGGIAERGATLLAQLNALNWLGALISALLGAAVILSTRLVCERASGVRLDYSTWTPGFILLLLLGRPESPFFLASLGLVVGLGLAAAYIGLGSERVPIRLVVGWAVTLASFYLAGVWACLLTVATVILFEARRQKSMAAWLALPVVVLATWIFGFGHAHPIRLLLPCPGATELGLTTALYLFCPAFTMLLVLRQRVFPLNSTCSEKGPPNLSRKARQVRSGGKKMSAAEPGVRPNAALRGVKSFKYALSAGALFCGGVLVWFGFEPALWTAARIDYYSAWGDDEAVIATAAKPGVILDPASQIRLNRALYHRGLLCESMFTFQNHARWYLLPGMRSGLGSCRAQSETLFELGLVNDAEHMAHEALEYDGNRPDLLQRLALINVLKGRPKAARVFLTVLGRVPFCSGVASGWIDQLQADPQLVSDKTLSQVRARMLPQDLPHAALPERELFESLLASNPQNSMAYEYLLAHFLLERDLKNVVEQLHTLEHFGYRHIPRHCEEALLLYQQQTGVRTVALCQWIRPETIQRFQEFARAMQQELYKDQAGRARLAAEFGDTYWYYFFSAQTASDSLGGRNGS